MEFLSVIRNECGEIVRYCSNYTHSQNEKFLEDHPEYYLSSEAVEE